MRIITNLRKAYPLLFLAILVALASCKKTEEIIIPDNTPPPDGTIPDLTVDSYINRAYIMLLGRKPDSTEFDAGKTTLRLNNLSQANRDAFVNSIMADGGYNQHLFDESRNFLLDNVDTTEIRGWIQLLQLLQTDPLQMDLWDEYAEEEAKLTAVINIPAELNAGTIDVVEMHRRLINNYVYDGLNMGTQNFVISLFQKFLYRYPTTEELAQGTTMVDGFPAFIFLESGRNKTDFISIFFNSLDYHEGQVRELFNSFLFREPGSVEMSSLSVEYKSSGDYNTLSRKILTTDEFIGL